MACEEAIKALNFMKDEWKSSLTDAVRDEIDLLILQLKLVDIFLRAQSCTKDSNIVHVSEHVRGVVSIVGSDLDNLASKAQFDHTLLSEVQQKIFVCKQEIRAQYSFNQPQPQTQPQLKLDSEKLADELIDTFDQLLSLSLANAQIILFVMNDFVSLKTFSHVLGFRNENSSQSFFTRAISITGDVAMCIFLSLPKFDNNSLIKDLLLERLLPIRPSVRQIYVEHLQSLNCEPFFDFSTTAPHSCLADMEGIFVLFVASNLLTLPFCYGAGWVVPREDPEQLKTFLEMLDCLSGFIGELPSPSFSTQLREIDNLMVDATFFVFSLYDKEDVALGEVSRAVSFDLANLIQRVSNLGYQLIRVSFQSISPKIDGIGFVDFLSDSMKEFLCHSADSLPPSDREQIEALLKELEFVQTFLRDVAAKQSAEYVRLQHLATLVIGKAFEIEYIVDCYKTNDVPGWCLSPWLLDLIEEIKFVKAEVRKIKEDEAGDATTDHANSASKVATSSQFPSKTEEMVGYEDIVQTLRDQLVRVIPRELDIISIVGPPGQGKTAIANKIFNDELVISLFAVRATCYVPVVFELRELLAVVLRDVIDNPADLSELPEGELADMLRNVLSSKRYLVLIDNVSDPVAWDNLRSCFPDAGNGSRILVTTRLDEVAEKVRRVSAPHYLRRFSVDESWVLLQKMVFPQQSFPTDLTNFGKQLARKCDGSPFRVVVTAGVLAKMTMKDVELLAKGDEGVNEVFSEAMRVMSEDMLDQERGLQPINIKNASQIRMSSQLAGTIAEEMVGFKDVLETIVDQLVGGTLERDAISIVGMAGQGKTTIANTLFIDELVVSRFDVRAKCCVSQVYDRREVLVAILRNVVDMPTDLSEVPEDELADKLKKLLIRKRYLILIDDVWETRALDELQLCFPDDNNGSRIILTTRLDEVANYSSNSPHHLRLFCEDESWTLLQKKVFLRPSCPPELEGVGQEIARKCAGLPLSIVLVAGVLASMPKKEQWEQVADDLSSHILGDSMHIIQFSYKNLPYYLKPCFLYFGAFLEDKEIQISKLLKLWAAEGLVVEQNERCLSDIAEDHLEELIKRNMVMPTKKRSLGKVKACCIHDLLLEFCKKKAKEEKFLLWIYREQDEHCDTMLTRIHVQRRICSYSNKDNLLRGSPSFSNVHSIQFKKVGDDVIPSVGNQVSFDFQSFKCLRVLDLEFVSIDSFPAELSRLRYLALRTAKESVPASISNLRNLETLQVKGLGSELSLPHSLCKMVKMRHLHINDRASFDLDNLEKFHEDPSQLANLETFSTPAFSTAEDAERVLRKTPNLRKLRCIFSGSWGLSDEQGEECNQFPKLQHLTKLESLKMLCFHSPERSPCEFNFPPVLKKLTLSGFRLPWSQISVISTLANLVVLKLHSDAFYGDEWEVRDEQFPLLKVLKLESMSFEQWSISDNAFSNLEQLVLHSCDCLDKIPSEFGDRCCLQSIEVKFCKESVANSARAVEEIQVDEMQNNSFKLSIG